MRPFLAELLKINMKKILVVDDDEAILEMIQLVLQESKYEVVTSKNGDILSLLTSKDRPDLILLDVLLSGVDGREIAKSIKEDSRINKIPVIMLSAHPSAADTVKKAGADDFIPKPFDIDYLLKVVERNLS